MKSTRTLVWSAILSLFGFTACSYEAGECWVRGEGEDGAGGGVIIGAGAGGFGDVPLEPQGAPAPADPCSGTVECKVNWNAGADVCKNKGTAGSCSTLYQGTHRSLDEAKKECELAYGVGKNTGVQSCGPCYWETSASSACEDKCWAEHDAGHQKCNKVKDEKARAKCHQVVNEQLASCLHECNKKKGN